MRATLFIGLMTFAFEAHARSGGSLLMKDLVRLFGRLFQQFTG